MRTGAMRSTVVKLTAMAPAMMEAGPWRGRDRTSTGSLGLRRMARLDLARQWMSGFDHLGQGVLRDVRVDLRRGGVGGAEPGLHGSKIRGALHQMRCKSMAQDMRREFLGIELGRDRQLLEHLVTTTARQISLGTARGKEKALRVCPAHAGGKEGIAHLQIILDHLLRRTIERSQALLLALSPDKQETVAGACGRQRQCHQFGNA